MQSHTGIVMPRAACAATTAPESREEPHTVKVVASEAHLDLHALDLISHAGASVRINEFHHDIPLALGQQLVPDPILVRKVSRAALGRVVLAEHACCGVASMVPAWLHASDQGLGMRRDRCQIREHS